MNGINTPPLIQSTPNTVAGVGSKYQYQVVATDSEGDGISYKLERYPTGMVIDTSTGVVNWTPSTSQVGTQTIEVAAVDAQGAVTKQVYQIMVGATAINQPPTITSTPLFNAGIGSQYQYQVVGNDPENGALSYALKSAPVGMVIDASTGLITWDSPIVGNHQVVVTAVDGGGMGVTQGYTLIAKANSAPIISSTPKIQSIVGNSYRYDVIARDGDGDALTYALDNASKAKGMVIDGNGRVTWLTPTVGSQPVTVTVTDTLGAMVSQSFNLEVLADASKPLVNLVSSTNIGKIGETLRFVVQATDNVGIKSSQLLVNGNAIPVNGMAISLTRTYDSLTAARQDDFGYGWRMEFRDTDLRTSLKRDVMYETYGYRTVGFQEGDRVYITLPGGKREGFTFRAKPLGTGDDAAMAGLITGFFATAGGIFKPSFEPDKGVTSKLDVPNNAFNFSDLATTPVPNNVDRGNKNNLLIQTQDGKLVNLAGRVYRPDDEGFGNRYVLTTTDGTVYEINATTGDLEQVKDTNGNVLTYSDTEISSSNGQKIVFGRDAQGRITSVTDPLGQKIEYGYDAQGDLVSVKDREGNTTGFGYNSSRAHYLEKIVDPLGREAVKTEYDENGRLKKTVNAGGNGVEFVYDPDNSVQTVKDALGNATTYEYDTRGNVLTEVDALGGVTRRTYDDENRELSVTDALGRTVSYTYDDRGNVTSSTDELGNITRSYYDSKNRLLSIVDPSGNLTSNTYDSRGNLTSISYADGSTAALTYDTANRITSIANSGFSLIKSEFDAAGNVIKEIDPYGYQTSYTYNAKGNRLSETKVINGKTLTSTLTYDSKGNLTSYQDFGGNITRSEYDSLGRKTEFEYDLAGNQILVRDALGNRTTSVYDRNGRLILNTDALGRKTQFTHDAFGRVTRQEFADGTSISTAFDKRGLTSTKTDRGGKVTTYTYDDIGRLTAVVDPLQSRTEYTYNALSRQTAQIDANGNKTQFEYDDRGRKNKTILALGQSSTTTYDAVGNISSTTDFNGEIINFEYNSLNRLITKRFSDGKIVSFSYTGTGQRQTETDERGTTTYRYDARDRLIERIDPDGINISYSYDLAGNLLTLTTLQGTVRYTYDALNRLKTVTDANAGVTTYTYDAVGNLIQTNLPNLTVEARSYDLLNQLTNINVSGNNSVVSNFQYTLDPAGNRVAVTEANGRKVKYAYDDNHRLIKEEIFTNGAILDRSFGYTYDAVGNRLTRNDSTAGLTTYTYDNNDRLMSEVTGAAVTTYSYDANGNVITKISGSERVKYDWNAENRLIGVDTNGDNIDDLNYQYNADGVRVAQFSNGQETRFLIDTNQPYAQVVEEYTPGGIIKASYVYGRDLISQERDSGQYFYHVDALGSTRVLTDENGLVRDRYIYDAFGQILQQVGTTENKYLFAGEQRDAATGLDYLRARYLNPSTGRFVSRDTFAGDWNSPVTLHRYLYANANPVMFVDPSGLSSLSIGEITSTNSISNILSTSYRFSTGVLRTIDTVNNTLTVANTIWSLMIALASPDTPLQTYLNQFSTFNIPSELLNNGNWFNDALNTLNANKGRILNSVVTKQLLPQNSSEIGKIRANLIESEKGTFIFYPPDFFPAFSRLIRTGISIPLVNTSKPLSIFMNRQRYRLFGVGTAKRFDRTTQNNNNSQFFRMDYGPYAPHTSGNWDDWEDGSFHFHVPMN